MADYHDAKVHNWWYDDEFNIYCAILETINGTLRFITETKKEEPKQ